MKTLFSPLFLLIALAGMSLFATAGCRKKKDTIVKVYVRNTANAPVSGCKVTLEGNGTVTGKNNILDRTATTNASGEALFNFNDLFDLGQAGVAVVDVTATYNGNSAHGVMKIEEEKTSEKTVFLQD